MRVLTLDSATGLNGIKLRTVDLPVPDKGEVRVRLKAAALNHRELWIAKGLYPDMRLPATLGCDGAGVIDSVGTGVDPARIGQGVVLYPGLGWGRDERFPAPQFGLLGMPGPGTIGEAICVPAGHALPKPAHLNFAEAAAIPLAAVTAWRGLFTKGGLKPGEKMLITGVGGGVAMFALLFGVALGAKVYVTSGSDDSLSKAADLGASGSVNYRHDAWSKTLRAMCNDINVAFDGAPAGGYSHYARSLATGARVVVYGSTGGLAFPVNAPELFLKNIQILGTNVGNLAEFHAMLCFVADHAVRPVIDRVFNLEDAVEALAHLENDHGFGKVVIEIDSTDAP